MNNFEFNYFFELYKDQTTLCHIRFKRNFKKKHPNVNIDLDKLIIEIEKYQINKYGSIKFSDYFVEKVDMEREKIKSWHKNYLKLGTKKERKERAMNKKKGE